MFRGAQKRIIMLKNPSGRYFEQAFFIISDEYAEENTPKTCDLVKEANRILEESRLPKNSTRDRRADGRFSGLFWFASGMFCSALLCALLLWFVF